MMHARMLSPTTCGLSPCSLSDGVGHDVSELLQDIHPPGPAHDLCPVVLEPYFWGNHIITLMASVRGNPDFQIPQSSLSVHILPQLPIVCFGNLGPDAINFRVLLGYAINHAEIPDLK
jgi:hypothetical protein